MIRPAAFGYNEETAANNHFQSADGKDDSDISQKAISEFDAMAEKLQSSGINVMVVDDTKEPVKPDAVFPNNWFSTHENGVIITYSLYSAKRRQEVREDIIKQLEEKYQYKKRYTFDHYSEEGLHLEGTGSMIFDRPNRIAYACLSPRTRIELLSKFGILMNYQPVYFTATDQDGNEIYHTNVMMSVGEKLAIVCLDSIADEQEKSSLIRSLQNTEKEILEISFDQMNQFAGNMLELRNDMGETFLVMSTTAHNALNKKQIELIEKYDKILHFEIPTIEKYGGGSVRCMIAEIFS